MAFRFNKPFDLRIQPAEACALYDILKWRVADVLDDDEAAFVEMLIARMKKYAEHKPAKDSSQ